jgi:DNA-binding transcriptional LysR family regulator
VFPNVEIRHLLAVIALAEELNFTRAADRLHITQPALSKQITDLEAEHRFHLFTRDTSDGLWNSRMQGVSSSKRPALRSRIRSGPCISLVLHTTGPIAFLTIGHSPYADHDWVSAMLAIRLPLYPRLEIRLKTQFAMESVHSVLVGEVNLALVTAPPQDAQITAVPFAPAPLYAVLPENHPAAHKERLVLQDLAKDEWILFAKRVHPLLHEAIMDAARRESIAPKHAHDVIAPQQAVDLVSEHVGVAILTQPTGARLSS